MHDHPTGDVLARRTWITASEQPEWLVVVGASGADGFDQLIELISALPQDFPAAVLVVLHRPMDRPSELHEVLERATGKQVLLARAGEPLRRSVCYIGPPDRHLCVGRHWTVALQGDHSYRNRTIDLLFRTAARQGGDRVVGVILAGALDDGAKGLAAIKAAGGRAMVVDAYWSRIAGMPHAAARAVPNMDAAGSVTHLAAALAALPHRLPLD